MAAYKNIAIIGGSGSVGKIVLEGLIDAATFNITALSRKDSEATFPAGVTVRKTDFSLEDLTAAFKGQDAVVSVVGAAAFGEQQKLVDAAVAAGVKRFMPSEFSASSLDAGVQQLLPMFSVKKDLIEYLKSKQSAGLSWTAISSSGLFDWGLANGFLGYDIKNKSATIWDDGNKRFTVTNAKQLGASVSSVLQRPQETANQFLYVASVETSQNEILAAFEEATGAKWTVNKVTTQEQIDEAVKKLGAGDFSGAVTLVLATIYSSAPGLHSNYAKDETLANETLGLKLEDLKGTVKAVLAA